MKATKKDIITYAAIGLVAVAIATAGILSKQSMLRITPLFISLIVSFLQSKVNRYASLLGGINSILYAIVYGYYKLYASMVYAVVFSCPIQLLTFARWRKHKWKQTTEFKKMSWKGRSLTAFGYAVAWCAMFAVLKFVGSDFAVLDNTLTLLGILNSFLMMFAFIEYTALMIPGVLVNIVLAASMLRQYPEQSAYLIYDIYCLVCQCIAFVNIRKAYREQQTKNTDNISIQ